MYAMFLVVAALGGGGEEVPATVGGTPATASCATCGTTGRARPCRQLNTHSPYGMMPQTCYDPTFGCYPGSRHMNRYPAFHGTYYRRPYNYRQTFDYPWHARMHEPTSMFSFNVDDSGAGGLPGPGMRGPEAVPSGKVLPTSRSSQASRVPQPRATTQPRTVTRTNAPTVQRVEPVRLTPAPAKRVASRTGSRTAGRGRR